jgi:hypothetical protein
MPHHLFVLQPAVLAYPKGRGTTRAPTRDEADCGHCLGARGRVLGLDELEATDPAYWAPRGYVIVNCDLRGWGRWLFARNPLTGRFPAAYEHSAKGTSVLHCGEHDAPLHLLTRRTGTSV